MDRRRVLRMLAVSSLFLSALARKALAQAGTKPSDVPPLIPLGDGAQAQGLGLPADWNFVAPLKWNEVDASLKAGLNSALRDSSPITLAGIRVVRSSGQIETGSLDPVGAAVELPDSVSSIVAPADEVLSLDVL